MAMGSGRAGTAAGRPGEAVGRGRPESRGAGASLRGAGSAALRPGEQRQGCAGVQGQVSRGARASRAVAARPSVGPAWARVAESFPGAQQCGRAAAPPPCPPQPSPAPPHSPAQPRRTAAVIPRSRVVADSARCAACPIDSRLGTGSESSEL